MRKFLFFVSAVLALNGAMAQDEVLIHTVDFEDLQLSPDSYYDGSDLAGSFESGDFKFQTNYDTQYSMWTGFAYSNMTDVTTPGFTNQFSAIPGKGAENSEIYAVFTSSFTGDTLWFPDWGGHNTADYKTNLSGFSITNTTYAYLSMRDGDSFAKKFGSPLNAAGDDDGTEGKDFFYVTFIAHDKNDNVLEEFDVYLADFRDADASNHYILDTWKEIEHEFDEETAYLTFSFTSSDNGLYGMNTPGYFALDNLKYSDYSIVATNELSASNAVTVYPNPANDVITVENFNGEASIYSVDGLLIKTIDVIENQSIQISDLIPGMYFLNANNSTVRFVKR